MEPPKLEQIKKWTVLNYKFTKQLVGEKFGHSTKTVDKELDVSNVVDNIRYRILFVVL